MYSNVGDHGEGNNNSLNKPAAWGNTLSEKPARQLQQQHPVEAPDSSRDPASASTSVESSADVEQHCLLFPTYATQHSRSGSKDPLDWNIRVRGWAFSKRSNRRKRLVMSMARKLAGVTKDNKVYETLESRFGMFLASNTQGARFSIQCVGPAKTRQMELAGDPSSHDPTVDVLLSELDTPDAVQAAEEAAEDKTRLRMSLELDRSEAGRDVVGNTQRQDGEEYRQRQTDLRSASANGSQQYTMDGAQPTRVASPESQEGSLLDRWNRGAALVKGTYRKFKPIVMAQVSNSGNYTHSGNASIDSLKLPHEKHSRSQASTNSSSSASDNSRDNSGASTPRTAILENAQRTDSLESIMSQTETHDEDLGRGMFPTVQISSKPGGHFDGTLRVSHEHVQAQRKKSKSSQVRRDAGVDSDEDSFEVGGHPRFLKLHAYHPEMTEHCHGVVNLIDPEGISIISDIDDTIKETNVSAGARIILRNTFLSDMRDVPGMSKVYKQWWEQGAAIHYVSNSPWQLIPSLLEFFHTHEFPPGSAHLRLHDSVLKTYFMEPGENKRRSIREILKDFPKRKFILVGDSGEIDMEIYTEMAQEFPDQIAKIFIRDITTARLVEAQARLAAPTATNTRSFVSMLPRAAGFFSRPADGAASEEWGGGSAGLSATTTRERPLHSGYSGTRTVSNGPSAAEKGDGTHNQDTHLFEELADTPRVQSESFRPLSSASTPSEAAATDPFRADWHSVKTLDDEEMPGAPPTEPPVSKTPLEMWEERQEICRQKLRNGVLTFFEDANELQGDPLVVEMFKKQTGYNSPDPDESKSESSSANSGEEVKTGKLVDI
ncbi:hypothetical protein EC968_004824 [Mortierella alpina]|nr:hypothetical protein EC968_004824 [Mortierella alpina]